VEEDVLIGSHDLSAGDVVVIDGDLEDAPDLRLRSAALVVKRGLSHVLNEEHREIVRVVVIAANDLERPARRDRNPVAGAHTSSGVSIVGGSAGLPSSRSSLKVFVIRSLLPLGPDGRTQPIAAWQARRACLLQPQPLILQPRPRQGPELGHEETRRLQRVLREPTPGLEPGTPSLRVKINCLGAVCHGVTEGGAEQGELPNAVEQFGSAPCPGSEAYGHGLDTQGLALSRLLLTPSATSV
jgi:hypothetical protein